MKIFKGGLLNPFNTTKMNYQYEVVEVGDVKQVEYEDQDEHYTMPERYVVLKTAGANWSSNHFYCILICKDALKPLREGELVSAELCFHVRKLDNEAYVQEIIASNVYTLHDYYQMKEAAAHHEGCLESKKKETD